MNEMLEQIAELSHEFGTEEYVLGGGGNTSAKDADHLWIKPSGTALPTMTPESFLKMNRSEVEKLNSAEAPEDVTKREAMVTQMLADAKDDIDDPRRP